MKKVAMVLALLLSIGMISCDDNADKPAETGTNTKTATSSIETYATTTAETTESTVMTTVETTETDTEEQTSPLPEFDINAPECLPYRLLNMTGAEIEAEFGKIELTGISEHSYGVRGFICMDDNKFELYCADPAECCIETDNGVFLLKNDVYPTSINTTSDKPVIVYPGFYRGQSTKDVAKMISEKMIPEWNRVYIISIGCVTTELYLEDYRVALLWDTPDEMYDQLEKEIENKSDEEKTIIKQKYADYFAEYLSNQDTYVNIVGISKIRN